MNLGKYGIFVKVFLVGMVATLAYKYMQSRTNQEDLVPAQLSEIDRPLANGRMEFWKADAKLDDGVAIDGNTPEAKALAETLVSQLGGGGKTTIFCMINEKDYVFLIKSSASLGENQVWSNAREAVLAKADGVPTIGVGVRGTKDYYWVIVGGSEPKPILVKESGPFTLYPYFYRAQGL